MTPEQEAALKAAREAKAAAPTMRATAGTMGGFGPQSAYTPPQPAAGPSGPQSAYMSPGQQAPSQMPPHPMNPKPTIGNMGPVPPSSMPAGPASVYPKPTVATMQAPPPSSMPAGPSSPYMPKPEGPSSRVINVPPSSMPAGPSSPYDGANGRPRSMSNAAAMGPNAGPVYQSVPRRIFNAAAEAVRNPGAIGKAAIDAAATPVGAATIRAGMSGAAAIPDALATGKVLDAHIRAGSPIQDTVVDTATQAAEGVGKLGMAGAGALGGAKLGAAAGTMLAGPPGTIIGGALGGVVGGAAGYFSADEGIKGLRQGFGVTEASPVDRLPTPITAEAAAQARANKTAETYARLGMKEPAVGGGAGRGETGGDPRKITMEGGFPLERYLAGYGEDGRAFDPTSGRGGGINNRLPTDLSMLQAGEVYKTQDPITGRTIYSGRDVKENAGIRDAWNVKTGQLTNTPNGNNFIQNYDASGKPVASANPLLSTEPSKGGMREMGLDQQLSAARQAAAARGDFAALDQSYGKAPAGVSGGGAIAGGFGGGKSSWQQGIDDRNASFERDKIMRTPGLSPYDAAQLANQFDDRQQRMREATMRDETSRYGADLGASTSRYGTDTNAGIHREHNQIQRENNQITRQIAAGQRDYQRYKDNIELGMKEREYQAERGDKDLSNRQAAEGALQKQLESRFTTSGITGDKVDTAAVARYRQGIDRSVARIPGARGVHDLGPRATEQLIAASDLLETLRADGSNLNPFKPDFLKTVDPIDLIGIQHDPKNDNYVITNPKSRAYKQVIPGRYLRTEEANRIEFGGMRGTPTNKYDMLQMGSGQ